MLNRTCKRLLPSFLALGILLATPARAEDGSAGEDTFQLGMKLFEARDFAGAAEAFSQSYAAAPSYKTLYNLGYAYRELGRTVDTLKTFEQFLEEGGDSIDALVRRAVQEEIDALRSKTGTLRLVVSPEKASIRIDGMPRTLEGPRGTMLLGAGTHRVEVELAGYEGDRQDVSVAAREEVTFAFTLKPVPPPPAPPVPPVTTTDGGRGRAGNSLRTLGYIAGGAGLLATAIGVFVGVDAKSKRDRSNRDCDDLDYCGAQGRKDRKAALNAADISTVSFVAGGVLLASGITLFVLGTPDAESSARSRRGVGSSLSARRLGLELEGSF